MESVTKIKWDDMRQAMPAFVSIVIMPFTYSIAYGIIGGLVMHFVIVGLDVLFDFLYSMMGCCEKTGCCKPEGERLDCCCMDSKGMPSCAVLMECLYEGPLGRFLGKQEQPKMASDQSEGADDDQENGDGQVELQTQ